MQPNTIMQILNDTAFIRTGGSPEELKCAEYIVAKCGEMGLEAHIESFPVAMARIDEAKLIVDGVEIPCQGYKGAGSHEAEAPLYYLPGKDPLSLSRCKGKIVLTDGRMAYWRYQDVADNGAVGFITYCGDVHYRDEDIDPRELRPHVSKGRKLPGVNIHAKSAIELVKNKAQSARIVLKQEEWEGESRNVVLNLPGEIEETIILSAHYDSTPTSLGVYDNMSGSVGLLALAEYFKDHPHRYSLRFVWCGSEERGLLGSKAYAAAHEEELEKFVLNVNLDMIGSIMGPFKACVTAEEKLVSYIEYFGSEIGFPIEAEQGVYPSDSTPFADKGVPALSFARLATHNTATIHNRYDTMAIMSGEQMAEDIGFVTAFVDRMANAAMLPVGRTMPEKMKEKLDIYNTRKRGDK